MSSPHQGYPGGPPHGKQVVFSYLPLWLNGEGFTYPTTEIPLSRSMSGPPSHLLSANILPSSYEEFADVGRDMSRQRRRRHARVRREHKTRTRRAVMLSPGEGEGEDQGPSLAGELSGSIDNLTAHHAAAHGGPGYSYHSPDPNRSSYGTSR